jgi:hypothetical protein
MQGSLSKIDTEVASAAVNSYLGIRGSDLIFLILMAIKKMCSISSFLLVLRVI